MTLPNSLARGRRRTGEPSGREQLLTSGLRYFARKGYDGTSLREIARDAGVDMALTARLFGSKQDFWCAIINHLVESRKEYEERLQEYIKIADTDPRNALGGLVDSFIRVSIEYPYLIPFMLQEIHNPGERRTRVIKDLLIPWRKACEPIIQACIAGKVVRANDPGTVFGMLASSIVLPMLIPQLCSDKRETPKKLANRLSLEASKVFLDV